MVKETIEIIEHVGSYLDLGDELMLKFYFIFTYVERYYGFVLSETFDLLLSC